MMPQRPMLAHAVLVATALLSGACSGSDAPSEELVPEASLVLERSASIGQYEIVPDGDGYLMIWAELAIGEATEQLYRAHLDADANLIGEPVLIKQVEDPGWTNLRLIPSQSGYTLWYWLRSHQIRTAILDPNGDHVTTVEPGGTIYGGRVGIAVIGDTTAVVWTNAYNEESFRLFNDQGTPRSDVVNFAGGEGITVVALGDHFQVIRGGNGEILTSNYGLDGLIIGTEEVLATEATFLESPVAHRMNGGTLVGWKRSLDVGTGAAFQYLKDDGGGWPESRILFAPNRLEGLDLFLGHSGETSLIGWESDATTAAPQLRLGQLDLTSRTFTSNVELASGESRPRLLEMVDIDVGQALFFRIDTPDANAVMFRQLNLP